MHGQAATVDPGPAPAVRAPAGPQRGRTGVTAGAADVHALLIHGAGAGGWEWDGWRRVLAAGGVAAIAPDLLPGAGGLAATRLADYRRQVVHAALGLPQPRVLVGASLGGLLALAAAAEVQPQALVLVNALPPAPLHASLPPREAPGPVVHWGRDATLAGTRRALPDADEATCLHAWRRWRDESGAVLAEALAGVSVATPACPVLVLASRHDDDVPAAVSRQLAEHLQAQFVLVDGSHVGPLLGRAWASSARLVAAWLKPFAR